MDFKYKIGQKVRVRSDLRNGAEYFMHSGPFAEEESTRIGWSWEDRKWFLGKHVTIESYYNGSYLIKEDPSDYNWTDDMFEEDKMFSCISLL